MDPSNPNKLIVSMWEHRRWPWFFKSGGPGSGVYITSDGGVNWKKLTNKEGMPDGELGRASFAFAANRSNIAYALVEAKAPALLRSEDGGFTWKSVNTSNQINFRPFYFSDINVNPKNENIVYKNETIMLVSEDGGKSFSTLTPYTNIHPDFHALWMHPDGERLICGNDGGLGFTQDRGKTWRFVQNLPIGQFYHISHDMEYPYNVYGGLQDNGSWRGPSNSFKRDAIYPSDWEMVGFGDGFATIPDPENSDFGYAMSQAGNLFYYNYKTAVQKYIQPTESDVKHRYNWNSGLALDPFDSKTIYYGSQFLHKSTDKGDSWKIISKDLTTNDSSKLKTETGGLTIDASGAENHCTILTIAPSAVKRGVIWVGTDDGNVHVTQDGGEKWELVSKNKGIDTPSATWVPHIEASKFDAGTAYLVMDNHRRSDFKAYVYVTRDFGKSWTSLVTKDIDMHAHVIEEDPVNKDLLWLGTEAGLFTSLNGGKNWMKWTYGVPTVPVYDLATQSRDNDLIIGTHGRSIYILDDVTPLRKLSTDITKKQLHLFDVSPGYQYNYAFWFGSNATGPGDAMFKGTQRPYGAVLNYYVNTPDSVRALEDTPKESKLKIEILDGDSVIRVIKGPQRRGMNRTSWDLSRRSFHRPKSVDSTDLESSGIFVSPGKYTVRIRYNGMVETKTVEVRPDPRFVTSAQGRAATDQLALKTGGLQEILARVAAQIDQQQKTIKAVMDFAGNLDTAKGNSIKRSATELQKKLTDFSAQVDPEPMPHGFNDFIPSLLRETGDLLYSVTSTYEAPAENSRVKYDKTKKNIQKFLTGYEALRSKEWMDFQKTASESGAILFKPTEKIELKD